MPNSPPSSMTSKWSSICPTQKATRIRNNQRRHRAKVRARISSLESELTESRRQLAAAEHRIKALAAEVERLQSEARRGSSFDALTSAAHRGINVASQADPKSRCCRTLSSQGQLQDLPTCEQNAMISSAPTSGREKDDFDLTLAFISQHDSPSLPPQQPGESTTSCATAYGIIAQQNFKGLGIDDVHQWLQSGYRRALRPGSGCTVVNSLVYSLINHLSPV